MSAALVLALVVAAAGASEDVLLPMQVAQCRSAAASAAVGGRCSSDGSDGASFEVELTPGAAFDVKFEATMVPGSLELLGARTENGASQAGWTTEGLALIVAFDSAETRFIPIAPAGLADHQLTELLDLHRSTTALVAVEAVGRNITVPTTGVWLKLRFNGRASSTPWMCPLARMHSLKVFQHSGIEMTQANGVLVNRNLRCIVRSLASLFETWGVRYVNDCGGMIATYRNHQFIPWDDDADIRVHADDWAKMQHSLLTQAVNVVIEPGNGKGDVRIFELKTDDGTPFFFKEWHEEDIDDPSKGLKYLDKDYPATKYPVSYYNCYCDRKQYGQGDANFKADLVRINHHSGSMLDRSAFMATELVDENWGGLTVKSVPYKEADGFLTDEFGPMSPDGDWRIPIVHMNECTNRFIDLKLARWTIKAIPSLAIILVAIVVYFAPLHWASAINHTVYVPLHMVAGAVLTFVGGASGRPWCGSAMAIAGWLNLAGHRLEHAHQARSSLPNENLKVGPTPTATFWAGREATIGKVLSAGVMVIMIYKPCDLYVDFDVRKAACQFPHSWWLQNVSAAMLLLCIAGAYGLLDQWRRLDGDTGNAMVRAIDTGAAVLSLSTFLDFGFESWEEPGYHGHHGDADDRTGSRALVGTIVLLGLGVSCRAVGSNFRRLRP